MRLLIFCALVILSNLLIALLNSDGVEYRRDSIASYSALGSTSSGYASGNLIPCRVKFAIPLRPRVFVASGLSNPILVTRFDEGITERKSL